MVPIDKGVPVPPHRNPAKKYPLDEMEVGDSFFAPGASARSITGSFARHRPKKFIVRTVTENGVAGARVWRIA